MGAVRAIVCACRLAEQVSKNCKGYRRRCDVSGAFSEKTKKELNN